MIGIPGMARFYRHVLIEKRFPHHTAVAFAHSGKVLCDAFRMLGIDEIDTPLAEGTPSRLDIPPPPRTTIMSELHGLWTDQEVFF